VARLPQQGSGYVYRQEQRTEAPSSERFDRIEYAMRALRVLRPRGLTVAVRETSAGLSVEQGRAWAEGDGARWAVVAIPPDASREAIAVAIAGLAGLEQSSLAVATVIGTGLELD
jgi:hypothetical protein